MPHVTDPIRIGTKTLKNRITMAPTVKFFAGDDGKVTPYFVRHYEKRAEAGCALICVEATCVSREGRLHPTQLGLWNDEQIEGNRQLTEACHRHGALVIPQLHHGGVGTHPACGPMKSPTAFKRVRDGVETMAEELSREEILQIEEQFVRAALRAQAAGYDGVQLHACHQYLINDFASELNQRGDEYGGSTENRARFGSRIIQRIRQACGEDFLISSRVSGLDPTPEEAIKTAEYYVSAGCDYLQVSCGVHDAGDYSRDASLLCTPIAALGVRMHEHFRGRVPVSCVNGILSPETARYLVENDLVDTVDLARGLLADPGLTGAILSGCGYSACRQCPSCGWGPVKHRFCPAAGRSTDLTE